MTTPTTTTTPSDEALMSAFARGDEASFRALYHRHASATLAFLLASTSNREAAEDMLQESFSRVFRHREDWRDGLRGGEGDSFRGWLFAIARNLARDAGRRATVRKRVAADFGDTAAATPAGAGVPLPGMGAASPAPDVAAERENLARKLGAALQRLPEAQREAFVLVRLQELTYDEVASACGITTAAAKMRVARATASLAELLGSDFDPPVAGKQS